MNKSTTLVIAKLKSLNIKPLSMAKYFYEKGIVSHLFIQKLIYFSFLEGLKNNLLFFSESFQAWKHGPVLRSVFDEMINCQSLDNMFEQVPSLKKEEVINILERIYQEYHDYDVWDLVEKSHQGPWTKARGNLSKEEVSTNKLELKDLVTFVNGQAQIEKS